MGILALPGYELWYLSFVAWVPLLVLLQRLRPGWAILAVMAGGFLYFLGSLYWLVLVTPIGWVVYSLYLSLYFLLFGALCRWSWTGRPHIPFVLAAPVIWVAVEFLRSATWAGPDWFLFNGFPWHLAGHPLYRRIILIQIADVTGAYGVSFLVITVNAWLAGLVGQLIENRKQKTENRKQKTNRRKTIMWTSVYVVGLLVGVLGYGHYRLREYSPVEGPRICLVQGNIPQDLKEVAAWAGMGAEARGREGARQRKHMLDTYMGLTVQASRTRKYDVLVWPETCVPGPLELFGDSLRAVQELCELADSYVLFGAVRSIVRPARPYLPSDTRRGHHNSVYFYSAEGGEPLGIYDKLHPVPFGEYMPMTGTFPWMERFMPTGYQANVVPGTDMVLFEMSGPAGRRWKFGTPICFEDTMPYLIRRFRRRGADFIINLTNDGWFGATFELDQPLAISVFRAVENRLGLVRAANTGISAFIEPSGTITAQLTDPDGRSRRVAGILCDTVMVDRRESPYSRHGDIFAVLCMGWTLVFLVLRWARLLTAPGLTPLFKK